MSQQAWFDPFTSEAIERGCHCCQNRVPSCYVLNYRILPTRLVRKRHRVREQKVIFCRSCYETGDFLPMLIDGNSCALQMRGLDIERQASIPCRHCRSPVLLGQGLYGLITSSLWMSGSCIESMPLALFCSECTENRTVTLQTEI